MIVMTAVITLDPLSHVTFPINVCSDNSVNRKIVETNSFERDNNEDVRTI